MVPTKKDADALTMIVWIGELVESTIVYMCLVTKNMVKETMTLKQTIEKCATDKKAHGFICRKFSILVITFNVNKKIINY